MRNRVSHAVSRLPLVSVAALVLSSTMAVASPSGRTHVPADVLILRPATNEPIRVVGLNFVDVRPSGRIPDVTVEISNESDHAVSFVAYTIDPPECPRWAHPMSILLRYGRVGRSPDDRADPPIPPRGKVRLIVKGSDLTTIRERARRGGCPTDAKIELAITHVAFVDGTGWEAFADGPSHAVWNGRPWKPNTALDPKP